MDKKPGAFSCGFLITAIIYICLMVIIYALIIIFGGC